MSRLLARAFAVSVLVLSPWWNVACSSTEQNGTDRPARGGSAGLGGSSGDAGTSGGGAGAGGSGATSGAGRGGGAGAAGDGGEGGETGQGGADSGSGGSSGTGNGGDAGAGDGGADTGGVSGVGGSGGAGTGGAGSGAVSGSAGAAGSAGGDTCPEGSTGANCDGCVIYVNQSGGSDSNDGRTWANAKANPQAGIDVAYASSPACEVWVAQGTYVPTYKADPFAAANTATLLLRPGIALYGGFAAGERSKGGRDLAAHATILTGEIGAATNTDNLARVITTAAAGASLDGFAVTRGYGVAIDCAGGSLALRNCTLYENTGYYGGALASSGTCAVHVADSVFRNNLATTSQLSGPRGAAIYANGGPLTIERSRFSSNQGTGGAPSGGAVFASNGVTLRESLFENNRVTAGTAGGLYVVGAATVESSTFRDNLALTGAAIYSTASLVVRGSHFENNLSSGDPALGAIRGRDIDVSDSTFTGNRAAAGNGATQAYGGAVAASGIVRIRRTTFEDNAVSAANGTGGGAFYCSATCSATLVAVRFRNGSVTGGSFSYGGGGAIYFAGTAFSADQCEFANNTALDTGGAIANRASSSSPANLTVTNSTFFGNSSESGGAIYNEYRPSTFLNSIFWDNTATVEGPQIFNASSSATSTVRSCNVQGSGFDGTNGNIEASPLFINTASTSPDLRLQAGSPCVNAGNNADLAADVLDLDADGNATETVPLDVGGVSRVEGGTVDMGAHERRP